MAISRNGMRIRNNDTFIYLLLYYLLWLKQNAQSVHMNGRQIQKCLWLVALAAETKLRLEN